MISTEKVINKYMIDDKITKEHIEHLRDINYYDALKLFDNGNIRYLYDDLFIEYIRHIIRKCLFITDTDSITDIIYKFFIVSGNVSRCLNMLRYNNIQYNQKLSNGRYRVNKEDIYNALNNGRCADIELDFIAHLLWYGRNYNELDSYIDSMLSKIKQLY